MLYSLRAMPEDIEKKIEELTRMVAENTRVVKKIRSVQKWNNIWTLLRYVIIIGLAIGAFYFVEPYYKQVQDLYAKGSAQFNSFSNFFSPSTTTPR